ncbi:class I SAM-dependent methyltransferase [Streptomyces sp. NBC_00239]|uniref:class I SAM-dependent methyltransferase n=1 Tax=Streptomyces sp. NBC_00239 TaxID=2903640 RepID=UPI002E2B99A6|nr:class I SAM-dependent methyltransferase [Streptomyces sp. NBC_00239]
MSAWVSAVIAVALGAGTVRARRRLHALAVLSPAAEPSASGGPGPRRRLLTARGVVADGSVLAAARAHADREGLDVLELLPADLAAEEALGLLRLVDPAGYRQDRLAAGRGAGYAVLVGEDVLERAGVDPDRARDRVDLLALTRRLKEYASAATDLAVAPGLSARAVSPGPGGRAAELRAQGLPPGLLSAAGLAGLALLATAVVQGGLWGVGAAGLYWLQPALVLGAGGPLRPADLAGACAARPLRSVRTALRTAVEARSARAAGSVQEAAEAGRRAAYAAELAGGADRFLEPRRATCPWCDAPRLAVRVRMPDLLQGKPGRFTLEECQACGHVFQNPRLTVEGLDFYYRDFYDGRGGEGAGTVFARLGASYRARAAMIAPYARPASWLDVGTGHGHFCDVAREVWPDTRFDGLDMGDGIHEAERRGWVSTGYQGQFPELAEKLAGRYDTVSMYHYLEHTRDPFAELDAAAQVLLAGGHLLIELPDPQSRMARLLGPHWLPWFQPQHQHLIPAANLRAALVERGFTVLAEEHGPAHQHNDFVGAVALTLNRLAPDPHSPWADPAAARPVRRAVRQAVRVAAVPCFLAAGALDTVRSAVARRTDGGNAYRLLARKESQ